MALTKVQAEGVNLADTFAFSGTVSGTNDTNHLVKLSSSTSSSNVTNVTFDTITSTYSSYLLQGSIVATDGQNSSADIYLRNGGSDVGSGNTGVAIYQGELINRAGADTPVGDVLNGSNAYLRLPCEREIYGGSIFSFTVQFLELNAGLLTGTTNLSNPNNRLIRNGWYSYSYQSVSASDYYGGHGWFRMDNPNANLTNITGIKINSGASNFVKHNVQLYGYVK
jgi:hypothetical protein